MALCGGSTTVFEYEVVFRKFVPHENIKSKRKTNKKNKSAASLVDGFLIIDQGNETLKLLRRYTIGKTREIDEKDVDSSDSDAAGSASLMSSVDNLEEEDKLCWNQKRRHQNQQNQRQHRKRQKRLLKSRVRAFDHVQSECAIDNSNSSMGQSTSSDTTTIVTSGTDAEISRWGECLKPNDELVFNSYDIQIVRCLNELQHQCSTQTSKFGSIGASVDNISVTKSSLTSAGGMNYRPSSQQKRIVYKQSLSMRSIDQNHAKISNNTSIIRAPSFKSNTSTKQIVITCNHETQRKDFSVSSDTGQYLPISKDYRTINDAASLTEEVPNKTVPIRNHLSTLHPLFQRQQRNSSNIIKSCSLTNARYTLSKETNQKQSENNFGACSMSSSHTNQKRAITFSDKDHPLSNKRQAACNRDNSEILPHIPLLSSIRNAFLPHQVTGVDFLWNALRKGSSSDGDATCRGAILADEMGMGKTLMTVAVITALHRVQRDKHFIVVCPSSLASNWEGEFHKWIGKASEPKCVAIRNGGEEGLRQMKTFCNRALGRKCYGSKGQHHLVKNTSGQVLIISYDLFRRHAKLFQHVDRFMSDDVPLRNATDFRNTNNKYGLVVVDEGHRLKNTNGSMILTALESIPTDGRLCITATPIQNNLSEFYALANFVCPGVLGDLASFRLSFERPITASNNKYATSYERQIGLQKSMELERISKSFMLRRKQIDVLKQILPQRLELLLFCQPSIDQCRLYQQIAQNSLGSTTQDALTALTSLRKVCSHPDLCSGRKMEIGKDKVHRDIESAEIHRSDLCAAQEVLKSGKLIVLHALLNSIRVASPSDKVVIVSNYTSALTLIEKIILNAKIINQCDLDNKNMQGGYRSFSYSRLDGSVDGKVRQQIVDTFNQTSVDRNFCLLLSAKAGGCGLNLTGANRLILFDPDWNPATDVQAMGRIYRQGQTKPCVIYRLFTSGTVEEVIYQRQAQKGDLATLTVDGAVRGHNAGAGLRFSKDELADCFTLNPNCECDTKTKIGKEWYDYNIRDPRKCLVEQGCLDDAILRVAETCKETLRFVHVVAEKHSMGECRHDPFDSTNYDLRVCPGRQDPQNKTDHNDNDQADIHSTSSSTSEEEFEL